MNEVIDLLNSDDEGEVHGFQLAKETPIMSSRQKPSPRKLPLNPVSQLSKACDGSDSDKSLEIVENPQLKETAMSLSTRKPSAKKLPARAPCVSLQPSETNNDSDDSIEIVGIQHHAKEASQLSSRKQSPRKIPANPYARTPRVSLSTGKHERALMPRKRPVNPYARAPPVSQVDWDSDSDDSLLMATPFFSRQAPTFSAAPRKRPVNSYARAPPVAQDEWDSDSDDSLLMATPVFSRPAPTFAAAPRKCSVNPYTRAPPVAQDAWDSYSDSDDSLLMATPVFSRPTPTFSAAPRKRPVNPYAQAPPVAQDAWDSCSDSVDSLLMAAPVFSLPTSSLITPPNQVRSVNDNDLASSSDSDSDDSLLMAAPVFSRPPSSLITPPNQVHSVNDNDSASSSEPIENNSIAKLLQSNLLQSESKKEKSLLMIQNNDQNGDDIKRFDCEEAKRRRLTLAQEMWGLNRSLGLCDDDNFDLGYNNAPPSTPSPVECDCGRPSALTGGRHICRYFGTFQCSCGYRWTSGYTWKGEMQACKSCDVESLPVMKEKLLTGVRRGIGGGPHDSARCSRCRKLGYNCSIYY